MSSPSGLICWCFLALAVWHVSASENLNAKDTKDDKYLSDAEAMQYMKDHPDFRPNFDFVPMDLAATTLTGGRDFENFDDRRPQDDQRPPKRQQSRLAADGRPDPKLRRQNSGPKPKLANSPKRSDSQRRRAGAGHKSPSIKSASLIRPKKPGNSPRRSQSPRRAAAPAA